MARSKQTGILAASILLAVGCGELPTVSVHDGLRLELTHLPAVILVGDSATVTIRLRNETARSVRLEFGSSCQIMPYIETEAGAVIYPDGGWGCATVLTTLDVPARGVVTRTVVIRGTLQPDGRFGPSLPPGRYRAYAALDPNAGRLSLRSQSVAFEVQ